MLRGDDGGEETGLVDVMKLWILDGSVEVNRYSKILLLEYLIVCEHWLCCSVEWL